MGLAAVHGFGRRDCALLQRVERAAGMEATAARQLQGFARRRRWADLLPEHRRDLHDCLGCLAVRQIDGKQTIKVAGEDVNPFALGKKLAQQAIAQGAGEILQLITEN